MAVHVNDDGPVRVVTLDRPEVRNAIDPPTATALKAAFVEFEACEDLAVLVLTGANGVFCSGADLKAVAGGAFSYDPEAVDGPEGPTRMTTTKPTIAAVEGPAVAGGLELALMCDLRVASASAVFGVYCRRWGVPLVDGGTVRLPRIIGQGRALDMILTGRPVDADEALSFGLANRVVPEGEALSAAVILAHQIAAFPQVCMRNDRDNAMAQWSLGFDEAIRREARLGEGSLKAGAAEGAARFVGGAGRSGRFGEEEPG